MNTYQNYDADRCCRMVIIQGYKWDIGTLFFITYIMKYGIMSIFAVLLPFFEINLNVCGSPSPLQRSPPTFSPSSFYFGQLLHAPLIGVTIGY